MTNFLWINILTAEGKTYCLFYMTLVSLLGGYSAQAIKECIDYELKPADNPLCTNELFDLLYFSVLLFLISDRLSQDPVRCWKQSLGSFGDQS